MTFEFSRQIFEKYSHTKFHENPSSVSRVAPFGQTGIQTDWQKNRQTDNQAWRSQ